MRSTHRVEWSASSEGAEARAVRLRRFGSDKRESDWRSFPAGAQVHDLLNASNPNTGEPIAELTSDGTIIVCSDFVAGLDEAMASTLDLPPATRVAVDLRSVGTPSMPTFRVDRRFCSNGGQTLQRTRTGPFLRSGTAIERLPSPLFELVLAAEALEEPVADAAARTAALQALSDVATRVGPDLTRDGFLENLRVAYASAVSLRFPSDDLGHFEPVLFGREVAERADGDRPDESEHTLLSGADEEAFLRDFVRHRGLSKGASLGGPNFVYFDDGVAGALRVIAEKRTAPPEERRAFALNPQRHLKDALARTVEDEEAIDRLFIETEQFSSRIEAVLEEWSPPLLPWVKPKPNSWVPERFGLRFGRETFEVTPAEAQDLETRFITAFEEGQSFVHFADYELPVNEDALEATRHVARAARALLSHEEENADLAEAPSDDSRPTESPVKLYLQVRDNFEEITYEKERVEERDGRDASGPPASMTSAFKPHQEQGFSWLTRAYSRGCTGVLLADDMGLGKTLQALAFIAWQRDQERVAGRRPRPCLIVAPTALQVNWLAEMDRHFETDAFGRRQRISGVYLKSMERGAASRLADHDVLVTTYETLRDHHIALAKLAVGVVVFDEVQKAKNPASQIAHTAKTVNADFVLSLTGTPVENRLHDLWSIMDVTYPGRLGSSKQFTEDYDEASEEALRRLHDVVTQGSDGKPPVMLRRMKSDVLSGLPEKKVYKRPRTMPSQQAAAYTAVLETARTASGKKNMLKALQGWRTLSVHPEEAPPFDPAMIAEVIQASARFVETFAVLDDVARCGEKAIIFLESLGWQRWLAEALRHHFRLLKPVSIINGSTPSISRQRIVDDFQGAGEGFGVLVLSPKAAGVGLTITAANHVVHLSRWWNPAVEDQATDRAYRIGQEKTVHVHLPQAVHPGFGEASFDVKLDQLMDRKRVMSSTLLAPSEVGGNELARFFDDIIA